MTDLRQAAQAVIDSWDSSLWKNGSTADAIADLRAALEQQQAEPIGWLDGNDKLAEFMHRDLKADHDKRGSATPREFTVPVYTAPPQQQAEPVACKTLCELCVKRGYDFCANVAKTTPIIISPTPPQQQAEPVFENLDYVAVVYSPSNAMLKAPLPIGTHLYKYPPQRKPLTDEEIDYWIGSNSTKKALVRAIEAAHNIKEGT